MKKGQFWYSDFMIGIIIMITIGLLFFSTIARLYESNDKIGDLISDGSLISDYFMSTGYMASQWSLGEGRIGFVNNGIVNENLDEFQSLEYNLSKTLFGINYDYLVYFENSEEDTETIKGPPGITPENVNDADTDYMIKLIRFVYYNGDIQKMAVVIWE